MASKLHCFYRICIYMTDVHVYTLTLNLNMKIYHHFTGYLSYTRTLMGKGLLQLQIDVHFREYCNGIYNRTGVNCFWIVDNSQQVLNRIRKTNYFSPAKHFDSFDFSTLYTSIPHDSLKITLTSLVKEAYRVRGNKFLVVDK